MKLKDLTNTIENGSAHLTLIDNDTGEIYLKTIWHNTVPEEFMDRKIAKIEVLDYELRIRLL